MPRVRRAVGSLVVAIAVLASLVAAGQAAACTIPTNLGVAFSIDDSGSMSTSDPDRLRSAATGAGIDQLPDGSYTAVSSFDSSSRSLVDPVVVTPANRPALKTQVDDGLTASGDTYYDLAFARAKTQLDSMPGTDKRALVFLSDGAPNGGDYTDELTAIKAAAIPVFTIGFGSAPGSVLAEIAGSTGGQAYTVQSPGEAQAVFARIVSTLTCDAQQVRENVTLAPGVTRAFPYAIGQSDREFRALATWSFGGVTVRLHRPDGSFLAPGTELAGERFISDETYASVIGRNPAVGGWELQVTAAAANVDDVDVSIDIFRRTSADPPDTFPLAAPAPGVQLPRAPVTFQWEGARNADGYELVIDDRVVLGGLSRDTYTTAFDLAGVPSSPGPHTWQVAAVNQFGRTLSERRPFTFAPLAPVVLVGGLDEDNPMVLATDPCRGLGDFLTLCTELTFAGHPVYVVPGSDGGGKRYYLDSHGSVRPNAAKLADFVRNVVEKAPASLRSGSAPLFVGHSMGGLIARTAISDYGVHAAGLFTIGTPHTGSYGADLAVDIVGAPCGAVNVFICLAIKATVTAVVASRGTDAVLDLTHAARAAENRVLRRPAKAWVLAGTACSFPFGDGYWTPNDGIVGQSSALGHGANLGAPAEFKASLWHTIRDQLLCDPFGTGADGHVRPNNEFTDPSVVSDVKAAAATLDPPVARAILRSTRAGAPAASLDVSAAATKPRKVHATFELMAARGRKLRPRRPAPLPPRTSLVAARKPFAIACRGKRMQAIALFGSDVYALDPTLAGCSQPMVVAPNAIGVLIGGNGARVRATLTIRGTRLTLSLRAHAPIRGATLRTGKLHVGTRRHRAGGRLVLTARVPARKRGRLQVDALVGRVRYSAYLPSR